MRERVEETNEGIQDAGEVEAYDLMLRTLHDRGWMETRAIIAAGLRSGRALEVGPGPGYLGLEWLVGTEATSLVGLEISEEMRSVASRNAKAYGLQDRVEYVAGNAMRMPFGDGEFDGVFTNGSLHEWEDAVAVFRESWRVLRPGGRVFVSDLRRDMTLPARLLMRWATKPRSMRKGLDSSIDAAYTPDELRRLVAEAGIPDADVRANLIGLQAVAEKPSP